MQIEWEWRVELDFPICGPGGTMSGDLRPTQRFLATSTAGTQSIGSCEATSPSPIFTQNFVGPGGYDADAMRRCFDRYYGSCSYYPGQVFCRYAVITSDIPFWIGVTGIDILHQGITQREPVYQAMAFFWENTCQGLLYTRCRTDFDANDVIDGADLAQLLARWGGSWPRFDLDESGRVDGADLGLLLNVWGPCTN